MKYYSTNHQSPVASLEEAVVKGLASDKGLFMPEAVKMLPEEFYDNIEHLSFQEIAYRVADAFFGEDVPADTLKQIVYDTLSFDVPAVKVKDNIYSLELFHGPTLAFKDVGGRFMARLLGYFIKKEGQKQVNVLVATSGDTGSAVANGFLGVEGIHVYVLYPKGKVSEIQEKQFTTLGQNITALEVDGTFDDCQALVKNAFMDADLNAHMKLTSANSINVARFLPQAFYYFYAYAQLKKEGKADNMVVCVPSGNFGNITAGLFGNRIVAEQQRSVGEVQAGIILLKAGQDAGSLVQRDDGQLHIRGNGSEIDFTRLFSAVQNRVDASINGDFLGTDVSGSKVHRCFLQNFCKIKDPELGLLVQSAISALLPASSVLPVAFLVATGRAA